MVKLLQEVVIAKSRRLEIRQLSKQTDDYNDNHNDNHNNNDDSHCTFNVVLSAPINGRITTLLPFRHPSSPTDYIFFITECKKYAVISYSQSTSTSTSTSSSSSSSSTKVHAHAHAHVHVHAHNVITHASGDLADYGLAMRGNEPEHGPMATLEPNHKCIALHLNEGYITILPIQQSYRYKPYSTTSHHHHHGNSGSGSGSGFGGGNSNSSKHNYYAMRSTTQQQHRQPSSHLF